MDKNWKIIGNQVEVLSGLSAKQYIVSAEGKLYNGAKVSVIVVFKFSLNNFKLLNLKL
jgi:hypothetical protein